MFFFFNDTATTEIYTLSLHDALPILLHLADQVRQDVGGLARARDDRREEVRDRLVVVELHLLGVDEDELDLTGDRKSTRLNSSHANISYAVFCLKKKKCIAAIFSAIT